MIERVFSLYCIAEFVLNTVIPKMRYKKNNLFSVDKLGGPFFVEIQNPYCRWAMYIMSILYVTLATYWSDVSGRRRKPLLFIPIVGQILQSLNGLMHSYFWDWNTNAAIVTNIIFEYAVGLNMMFIAAQIYICDTSSLESRTARLGLLWVLRSLCKVMGIGVLELSMNYLNVVYLYCLCFALSFNSLMLATEEIKDTSVAPAERQSFLQLFSARRIVYSYNVVFKITLGSKRLLVLFLMIIYVAIYSAYQGEMETVPFFVRRKLTLLNLRNENALEAFVCIRELMVIFGTLFCCFVLSNRLRIRDVRIGIFAVICNILGVMAFFLADDIVHFWIGTILNVFHGAVLCTSVSFLSRFYEKHEYGRFFGVLNIFFSIPLFSQWAYSFIVWKTYKCYPAPFLLNSFYLNFIALGLYCISLMFWRFINAPDDELRLL